MSARRIPRSWPVLLLAAPAFVAIWSGWVGLGGLTGFGVVHPLPGTPWAETTLDTAITLPVGVETYAAYALHVWLSRTAPERAARFAKYSALGALMLGAAGQVTYHLMIAAHMLKAPWPITALVACLPVAVLGMGAALAHLVTETPTAATPAGDTKPREIDSGGGLEQDSGDSATLLKASPTIEAPPPAPAPPTTTPRRARGSGRAEAGVQSPTRVKVLRLRAQHPDWTLAQIAKRAGCAERTVRRHLNAAPTSHPTGEGGGPAETVPAAADVAA